MLRGSQTNQVRTELANIDKKWLLFLLLFPAMDKREGCFTLASTFTCADSGVANIVENFQTTRSTSKQFYTPGMA